jgi:hypothetical protein
MTMQPVGLTVKIEGLSAFEAAARKVNQHGKDLGEQFDKTAQHSEGMATKIGHAFTNVGKVVAIGAAAATAAFAAVGVASISAAANFESTISSIKAVSGATATEIEQVSKLALQLGKDTSFSASQAAAGIEELIKGGISIPDVMNGAAEAMLNLAAAGGVSLPDAAEIASNALAMFNLKGADMAHVADLIAGAANASSLSVSDFKFSLAASGAVAAASGQNFDDLAQAIAVLGQAGLRGSDAGTSLKTFLMNLQPTTKKATETMRELGLVVTQSEVIYQDLVARGVSPAIAALEDNEEQLKKMVTGWDGKKKMTQDQQDTWAKYAQKVGITTNAFIDAEGKFKSMTEISGILQKATEGLTDAEKMMALEVIFGSDAIRAAAIFAKAGEKGFTDMAASMGKVTAASVGAEKLNNLKGSIEQLKGSLETAAITLGMAFLPKLRDVTDGVTKAVNAMIPWIEQVSPDLVKWLDKVGKAVGNFAGTLANLARLAGDVFEGKLDFGRWLDVSLQTLKPMADTVGRAFGDLWSRINWGAIWEQATNIVGAITSWLGEQWAKIDWGSVWAKVKDIGQALAGGVASIADAVTGWLGEQWAKVKWAEVWAAVRGIGAVLASNIVSIVDNVTNWLSNMWSKIDWASIWASVTSIGSALAANIMAIYSNVTSWLAAQWAKIDWTAVWQTVGSIGAAFVETVQPITADAVAWLKKSWEAINWLEIWAATRRLDETAAVWIDQQDWAGLGRKLGQQVLDMFRTGFSDENTTGGIHNIPTPQMIAKMFPVSTIWEINKAIIEVTINFGIAMIDGIVQGLGGLAGAVGRKLSDSLSNAVQMARDTLGIHSPSTVTKTVGEQMVGGLLAGVVNLGDVLGKEMSQQIQVGLGALSKALDLGGLVKGGGGIAIILVNLGKTMGESLASGVSAAIEEMPDPISRDMQTALAGGLARATEPMTKQIDTDMQTALAGGFLRATESMPDPIARDMAIALAGGLSRARESVETGAVNQAVESVGKSIVQGIADGVMGSVDMLSKAASAVADAAVEAVSEALDIGSPSKVMQIIGEQMIEGLTLGITDAGRTFNEVFHRVFDETFEWWDREGLNLFDFMRAQAEQFARDQASNMAFVFDEMKGGRKGIEDLMKVLEQMYGGLAKIVSPLTDIMDLIAAPVTQQYEDQIKAVNDQLKEQNTAYADQMDALADWSRYRQNVHDAEMATISDEIDLLNEKIALEQRPYLDQQMAANEEYQKLQAEGNVADLYFAREREKAHTTGDKKRLDDLKLEEDSYRDNQRYRLDVLRAEMAVSKDQMDAVADRHAAELTALQAEQAAKKDAWDAEQDAIKRRREALEATNKVQREAAAERLKEIAAEEKAALIANNTIRGLLDTIAALQAKTAEMEMIKTVSLIANTLSSAGMQIPQAVLDAFAALPREAGGMLDSVINALLAAYGRGLYGAAEGAVVTRPTVLMAGEGSEPEAILPLSSLRGLVDSVLSRVLGGRVGMPMPGAMLRAGGGSTFTQQRTYQLSASYAQVQSESSIMLDLQAMEMLAGARG